MLPVVKEFTKCQVLQDDSPKNGNENRRAARLLITGFSGKSWTNFAIASFYASFGHQDLQELTLGTDPRMLK